ncbi:hypothetical protein [Paenibacillus glycinis]|uniref:NHLP leader peptide family natural product n=1 Tax=Paenibacillus glycinis TaxID=2697035 RepID=A0ABW9XR80_9BACL|nr:hypothetical protein [Paenibacillus glycinis]NBD25156.1 hypothetical protein [Paenibacillus glycinis]
MSWTKEALEAAIQKVSARAATDAEFRSLCASDIRAAIRLEDGLEVPASFKIGVLDASANHLNLILPPIAKEDGELLENELEGVAGGSSGGWENSIGIVPIFGGIGIMPVKPVGGGFVIPEKPPTAE